MLAVPMLVMSLAGTCAVSCVELTKLLGRAAPFHFTTETLTKLLPFTAIVNVVPPALALAGDSELMPGTGLLIGNVRQSKFHRPGQGW